MKDDIPLIAFWGIYGFNTKSQTFLKGSQQMQNEKVNVGK